MSIRRPLHRASLLASGVALVAVASLGAVTNVASATSDASTSGPSDSVAPTTSRPARTKLAKPTVVLVHGAWGPPRAALPRPPCGMCSIIATAR